MIFLAISRIKARGGKLATLLSLTRRFIRLVEFVGLSDFESRTR